MVVRSVVKDVVDSIEASAVGNSFNLPKYEFLARHSGVAEDDKLIDQNATGTHEATKPVSLEFSGAQYGSVDLTGYEYLNEECWRISFSFYNSVAIDKATSNAQAIQVDTDTTTDGIKFGAVTAALTDEIITVLSGSNGSSGWISAAGSIAIGMHTVAIQWSGIGYDIYLDDVKVNNATAGTEAVLILDTLTIGRASTAANYLNNTNLYDIEIQREDGTVIWENYLAQGTGATSESVVGPEVTLNGFTLDDDWTRDARFGHSWNVESYYSGASGFIPEDPSNPGYAVTGEALNRIGPARQNMGITGYAGDFDGISSGVLNETVILSGDCGLVAELNLALTEAQYLTDYASSPYDNLRFDGTNWRISINGAGVSFPSVTNTVGTLSFIRTGDQFVFSVGDQSTSGTCSTDDFSMTSIGKSSDSLNGSMPYIQVYNSTDTLIHHWVIQSGKTKTQTTIYDIIGGNHATLSGATLPFFTEEIEGSIFTAGGTATATEIIPADPNNPGFNVLGNALTFTNILDAPADTALLTALETAEMWAADSTLNKWLDVSGIAIPRDPATIEANYLDQYFKSLKGLALYLTSQTGNALNKILKWMKL